MTKPKHIHFVGIKGVGMTPLALIAQEAGIQVSGCDVADEFITDEVLRKQRIKVFEGFSPGHTQEADMVVTTAAHGGLENMEVKSALASGKKVLTQAQAVGEFMNGEILGRSFRGITVAGTHGKTTTTAMIATIFEEAGLEPSYIIGTSNVPSLRAPGVLGKGKYFIAEGDEYVTDSPEGKKAKFLWQNPVYAVITNIELDHPDVYSSEDEVVSSFAQLAERVAGSAGGKVILNADDRNSMKLKNRLKGGCITFGKDKNSDYIINNIDISTSSTFSLKKDGREVMRAGVRLMGEHNVFNAAAAAVLAIELGLPLIKIKDGLSKYKGSKRRLEYIGETGDGALVFDDYAHHPTEIKKTLEAVRLLDKNKEIVCIFQPHTYSRTKYLFEQFIDSFNTANRLIITNIYASAREKPEKGFSSLNLVDALRKKKKDVLYLPELQDVVEYMDQREWGKKSLIIFMGAGDIYKAAQRLVEGS